MISFEAFSENCSRVRERVAEACAACGRDPAEVKILPVTKNHPAEAPLYAARAGFRAVGENRVQEAQEKQKAFAALQEISSAGTVAPPDWELIGHLQSNKARRAAKKAAAKPVKA